MHIPRIYRIYHAYTAYTIYHAYTTHILCRSTSTAAVPSFCPAACAACVCAARVGAHQRGQRAPLAGPQLGSRASSGRAWRLWAARHSQEEVGPLGAQPLPRLLELAASKAAEPTAFGHLGTPQQLCCRSLDVRVGRASIDLAGLATQRILLRQPALGQAAIVFNQRDWGRFLVHPLMADALRRFAAAYLPPPSPPPSPSPPSPPPSPSPPSPSPPSPPPAERFHQAGASFAPGAVRFGLDYNGAPPKASQGTHTWLQPGR